jgi:hypothetical protein
MSIAVLDLLDLCALLRSVEMVMTARHVAVPSADGSD